MSLFARVEAPVGSLALRVQLEVNSGTVAIIGPNGSGKTSLLLAILGLLPRTRGKVQLGDAVLFDSEANIAVPVEERRIGYLPQHYALFPHLTVRDNVVFALQSAFPRLEDNLAQERAQTLLTSLGIAHLALRHPHRLSGGERQRVALARALAVEPRALMLDEPLAALDIPARGVVRTFLAQTLRHLGLPSLLVTHDPADARTLATQLVVLEEGRILQVGSWTELAEKPASAFVAQFVA